MLLKPKGPTLDGIKFPEKNLVGCDGNAYGVMAFTIKELERAGNSKEVIERYKDEAKSGDYDHLLMVSIAYLES
jgi:hypothetical protein